MNIPLDQLLDLITETDLGNVIENVEIKQVTGRIEGEDLEGQRVTRKPNAAKMYVSNKKLCIRVDSSQILSFWCEMNIPLDQIVGLMPC